MQNKAEDIMEDLEERVHKFKTLSLPGQPMSMHLGTSYLVSDLWREVQRLREQLEAAEHPHSLDGAVCAACGGTVNKCSSCDAVVTSNLPRK